LAGEQGAEQGQVAQARNLVDLMAVLAAVVTTDQQSLPILDDGQGTDAAFAHSGQSADLALVLDTAIFDVDREFDPAPVAGALDKARGDTQRRADRDRR